MKKFILQLTLFLCIIAMLYVLISIIVSKNPQQTNDYLGAIEIKHNRLITLKKSKIILIGGSNLAFGIDSKKMEEDIGRPVINMGLFAGLGLKFMLAEIDTNVKPGDIIIVSPEYFLDKEGEYEIKNLASTLYPPATNYYKRNILDDFRAHLNRTRKNLEIVINKKQNSLDEVYSKKSFNEHGDMVGHLKLKRKNSLKKEAKMQYRYWEGIELLNRFYEKMQSRNVSVFFIYPPIAFSEFEENKKIIINYKDDIKKNLTMKILGTPEEFAFQDTLFFDTKYHLTREGRFLRTQKFIELLKIENEVLYLNGNFY